MTDLDFRMHAERTPNPNSIKWVLSVPVVAGVASAYFREAPTPEISPLASRLFAVPGVLGVFLGPNFITVTKQEGAEWLDLAQPVVDAIKGWVEHREAPLGPAYVPPESGEGGEIVARIIEILERDIRPYVAMDGGEISFSNYRDGVVEVHLQGSCSGCPSSTMTLKMGIEQRLKEEIPEVVEVVPV